MSPTAALHIIIMLSPLSAHAALHIIIMLSPLSAHAALHIIIMHLLSLRIHTLCWCLFWKAVAQMSFLLIKELLNSTSLSLACDRHHLHRRQQAAVLCEAQPSTRAIKPSNRILTRISKPDETPTKQFTSFNVDSDWLSFCDCEINERGLLVEITDFVKTVRTIVLTFFTKSV